MIKRNETAAAHANSINDRFRRLNWPPCESGFETRRFRHTNANTRWSVGWFSFRTESQGALKGYGHDQRKKETKSKDLRSAPGTGGYAIWVDRGLWNFSFFFNPFWYSSHNNKMRRLLTLRFIWIDRRIVSRPGRNLRVVRTRWTLINNIITLP